MHTPRPVRVSAGGRRGREQGGGGSAAAQESLAEGLRQIAEECEEQCRLVRDEADVDAAFQVAPTAA